MVLNKLNDFYLKKNDLLAELVGILLGDGHLQKKGEKYYLGSLLSISLNRIEESKYVEYVRQLLIELFKIEPKMHARIDSKSIDFKIYNENIIDFLILKGLLIGNKVQNLISVPNWIRKDEMWIKKHQEDWKVNYRPRVIRCLRGLVDTDGSIYIDHFNKIIGISF
jgi:hypothetical protein